MDERLERAPQTMDVEEAERLWQITVSNDVLDMPFRGYPRSYHLDSTFTFKSMKMEMELEFPVFDPLKGIWEKEKVEGFVKVTWGSTVSVDLVISRYTIPRYNKDEVQLYPFTLRGILLLMENDWLAELATTMVKKVTERVVLAERPLKRLVEFTGGRVPPPPPPRRARARALSKGLMGLREAVAGLDSALSYVEALIDAVRLEVRDREYTFRDVVNVVVDPVIGKPNWDAGFCAEEVHTFRSASLRSFSRSRKLVIGLNKVFPGLRRPDALELDVPGVSGAIMLALNPHLVDLLAEKLKRKAAADVDPAAYYLAEVISQHKL